MEQEKPKRKTTTSWQVKQKYNDKTYSQVAVRIKKELVAQFEEKLKQTGDSKAKVIREAIENYIENK